MIKNSFTKSLLIASLFAVPLVAASPSATARTCPRAGGGCSQVDPVEQAVKLIDGAKSTVESAPLETAYTKIKSVAAEVEKLRAMRSRDVQQKLGALAGTLKDRADHQYDEAMSLYEQGRHDEALKLLEELAKLEGVPAATQASRELDKEPDRLAWREARDLATEQVAAGKYIAARESVAEVDRLSRRTGYTQQTKDLMSNLSEQLLPKVEAAEQQVAQQQYDQAYATLVEISRLPQLRQSAGAARTALSKSISEPGMRQAKGEYEANEALEQLKAWYTAIAHPSSAETEKYQKQLASIAERFEGTQAAKLALEMMSPGDDAQATR